MTPEEFAAEKLAGRIAPEANYRDGWAGRTVAYVEKAIVVVRYRPPLSTLGALRAALDDIVRDNPNPTEEPRAIKLECSPLGKVKAITVEALS